MAGSQLALNPAWRKALAPAGAGHPGRRGDPQDDGPVDAEAGGRPVAAVDVADEIRIRIAPAKHRVVRAHHRWPNVGELSGEQLGLADADAVVGKALLPGRRRGTETQ